jgi:hypothetical protein
MFGRVLLVIAVLIGLAVGPALPREHCWASAVATVCKCCDGNKARSCCAIETSPAERTPLPAANSAASDLKLALQPLVSLLPRIFALEQAKVKVVAVISVVAPAGVQLDRICVRLI